jgi:hypothetical protein
MQQGAVSHPSLSSATTECEICFFWLTSTQSAFDAPLGQRLTSEDYKSLFIGAFPPYK